MYTNSIATRSSQPNYMAAKQSFKSEVCKATSKAPTSSSTSRTTNATSRFMVPTCSSKQSEIAAVKKSVDMMKSSSKVVAKKGHGGVTIPEPFNFTAKNRSNDKLVGCKSPVMSLAVQARLFESSSLRASTVNTGRVYSQDMKLTEAKSPKFHAIHKKPLPPSTEELEVSKIANKSVFKHNSVNPKVITSISYMDHSFTQPFHRVHIHICEFRSCRARENWVFQRSNHAL